MGRCPAAGVTRAVAYPLTSVVVALARKHPYPHGPHWDFVSTLTRAAISTTVFLLLLLLLLLVYLPIYWQHPRIAPAALQKERRITRFHL